MANQHTALPMPERFWSRTQYTLTGCLEWMGARQAIGYGVFGKRVAHRVAYEIANGPVPAGLELDHLCGNRRCRACKKAWNDAHPNRDARQLTYYARLGSQEGSE